MTAPKDFIAAGLEAYQHVDEYEAAGVRFELDEDGVPCLAPPDNLPKHMRPGMIYRGKDGRWYHPDGRLVSREERRRAGVK